MTPTRAASLAALTLSLLAACTAPAPRYITASCPAAQNLPEAPPRHITTDPRDPGAVVRAAEVNRRQWRAHADELTTRLVSCR